jgi:hypothetical protein
MNKTIIFVIGAGHSGSTVLAKTLNAHSKVFALCEIGNFHVDIQSKIAQCGCGVFLRDCPFWDDIDQILKKRLNFGIKEHPNRFRISRVEGKNSLFDRIVFRLSRIAAIFIGIRSKYICSRLENIKILFDIVINETKSPCLVDTSKSAKRAYLLKKYFIKNGYNVKIVHLVRDGRAVMYSYLKGYYNVKLKNSKTGREEMKTFYSEKNRTPEEVVSLWKAANFEAEIYHNILSKNNYNLLRYEDFTGSPEIILQEILPTLGLEYEKEMLDLNRYDNHMVSGNASRINATRIQKPINSWAEKLTEDEISYFNKKAGRMNKKYGY